MTEATDKQRLFEVIDSFDLTKEQVEHFRTEPELDVAFDEAYIERSQACGEDEPIWGWVDDSIIDLFANAVCSTTPDSWSEAQRDAQIDEAYELGSRLMSILYGEVKDG